MNIVISYLLAGIAFCLIKQKSVERNVLIANEMLKKNFDEKTVSEGKHFLLAFNYFILILFWPILIFVWRSK